MLRILTHVDVVIVPPEVAELGNLGVVGLEEQTSLNAHLAMIESAVVKTHIRDVSRPAAGEHDGPPGGVEGSAHVGIAGVVVRWGGMATVQLQHVHAPVGKCLYQDGRVTVCKNSQACG